MNQPQCQPELVRMETFVKPVTLQPRPGLAGAPQPISNAADKRENWPTLKPKHQQTRYLMMNGLRPLKLVPDKASLPSINRRANTVEPWSERNHKVDVNKVKPTRPCRFPLLPLTGAQGSVKPQGAEESNRNHPGAHINMETLDRKPQKRPVTGMSGLKPLRPVPPQDPNISNCIGIVPAPRLKPVNHQPASGSTRVFRRFHEVLLEEPPRVERRTSKQRSASVYKRWQQENGGGLVDEETAADSKVPGSSSSSEGGCEDSCSWDPSTFNVIITYKNTNVPYPKIRDRVD